MIPTFLTTLALGVLTLLTGQITALAAFTQGSLIVAGNMFYDTTNTPNPGTYIGTKLMRTESGVGLNFNTNGTQTGVVLQEAKVTQLAIRDVPCTLTQTIGGTGSGGRANYPFCLAKSPFTTTGALTALSLECGGVGTATNTMSGGFVKTSTQAVGALPTKAFTNFLSVASNTGAALRASFTGTSLQLWNPADLIKVQILNAGGLINPTSNCVLRYQAHDKFGT